jgi:hypothetical protein
MHTVIAKGKPSGPNSRLSTRFNLEADLDVKREEIKGMREGPRERERLRA